LLASYQVCRYITAKVDDSRQGCGASSICGVTAIDRMPPPLLLLLLSL
jgi:hypothetical protein